MNLLADFAWIGEKTKCLARVLKNKNYDFYTGCKYLNTEFEIGSAVTIKYKNKFQIGIIHYFYDIPLLSNVEKYRVAVELYYRPKDLKINDNTTLHFDFELLKQDKPILTFLPIVNIKSRCSIVYGLEDENPEELLREFSDTTTDIIYICRFIAAPNRKNGYNLRGVVQNTIEISDDEIDNPVNVAEIEVSSTSNKPKPENKETQNDNIHIKIQSTFSSRSEPRDGFQIDVSNDQQSESDHGTNNIFTISNVGDANNIKLKFTRTKNVSSVSVESSFTNKSQNDIKASPNPQVHSVNAHLSLSKNTVKVSQNDPDDIFPESSINKQNESENSDKINLESSQGKKKSHMLQTPKNKQRFKKISLSHLFTDNLPESDSSYEVYEEIDLDNSCKNAPKRTKIFKKKLPSFCEKNSIEDSPESETSSEAFDHIDSKIAKPKKKSPPFNNRIADSTKSNSSRKLAKKSPPFYKKKQNRTEVSSETSSSSETFDHIAPKIANNQQKKSPPFYKKIQNRTDVSSETSSSSETYDHIAPKVAKTHPKKSPPFYKKIQNRTDDLLESDSSSDHIANSCEIAAPKIAKKSPPFYNLIVDSTESDSSSESCDHIDPLRSKSAKTHILNSDQTKTPSNENNENIASILPKKHILKQNDDESSSILMPKQSLIEPSKSNPVVLLEKIKMEKKSDNITHKRDFVRESLLNEISKENPVRKSMRVTNKSYIENRISLASQTTLDSSSDSEFSIAQCTDDSSSEDGLNETHENDEIFESFPLRPKTPTSTRVLRSKSQTKENISPFCETQFKKTDKSQRSRIKSVSEINSLNKKQLSLKSDYSLNEPNKQCRIKSEPVNDSTEDLEISKTDENVRPKRQYRLRSESVNDSIEDIEIPKSKIAKRQYRSESESNSSQQAAKILHLSKYELRPKTPVNEIKTPKRNFSRVKFEEECEEVKSSKKHRIEENVISRRSSTRGKRIVCRDSSDESFRTPKKQSKFVTPKSVRVLLKNMTPGIEERDEAVASCSTPMRKARLGLSAHSVPTHMPCREKEYLNIYNFIAGKITDKSSGCMYISGVPGTGKTMTVFKVMQNITDNFSFQSVTFLKLNALALTEPRQIYVEIVKLLISKTLHWEAALNEIQRFFKSKKEKRPHILLIDELDKLCNRKQDVIYNLLDLPFHSKIPLVVITIANTMDLPERILTNKVNSRLGLTRLTFKPYQFKELVHIVTARLSNEKVFKPEALELVARKVAAVSGDARRALAMCSRATEIAEEETHDLVNMEIINRVMFEMISSSSSQAVKSCSKIEQFILTAISNEVLRTGNEEVPFVSMLENLKKLCYLEKVTVPGTGVCLKLCQHLGSFRLLITQHARYDLNMTLMLNISPDDIHFALR